MREDAIERRWREAAPSPTRVWKLTPQHSRNDEFLVYESRILDGGNHVLFVFTDGSVDVRSVVNDSRTLAVIPSECNDACETTEDPLVFIKHSLFMFSANKGYLILELTHEDHR
jgi:hypothetical protein